MTLPTAWLRLSRRIFPQHKSTRKRKRRREAGTKQGHKKLCMTFCMRFEMRSIWWPFCFVLLSCFHQNVYQNSYLHAGFAFLLLPCERVGLTDCTFFRLTLVRKRLCDSSSVWAYRGTMNVHELLLEMQLPTEGASHASAKDWNYTPEDSSHDTECFFVPRTGHA